MDDHESILELLELMHKQTRTANELFVESGNAFDTNGNMDILKRHISEIKRTIENTENIISSLEGV